MADEANDAGFAESYMTLKSYTKRARVERTACDVHVPPAADSIIGHCEYYYRPLQCEYTETVEKVTAGSAWATVKAFATSWDPWTDKEAPPVCCTSDRRSFSPNAPLPTGPGIATS